MGGCEEQTARGKQGGARVVTKPMPTSVWAWYYSCHVLLVTVKSCVQIRVQDGTGKLEHLRAFAISDALSLVWGAGRAEAETPRVLWGLCGSQLSRHGCCL